MTADKNLPLKLIFALVMISSIITMWAVVKNAFLIPYDSNLLQQREPREEEKLGIEDLKVGTGAEAESGDALELYYKGMLENGTVFDETKKGKTFKFTLGKGEVIAGWDMGIAGMKVGGKRKLTIPAALGYGDKELPNIPPNSRLIFEIELVKVSKKN